MSRESRQPGAAVAAVVGALALLGGLGVVLVTSGGGPAPKLVAPAAAAATPSTAGQVLASTSQAADAGVPGAPAVTTSDPARQEDAAGTAIQLQVTSPNVADGQPAQFAASDLPPGLSISSSGLIAGTISPTASGTYQVTVTSTPPSGATGSVSFLWTVTSGQPSPPLRRLRLRRRHRP